MRRTVRRPSPAPSGGLRGASSEAVRQRIRARDADQPAMQVGMLYDGLPARVVSLTVPRAKHNQHAQRRRMSNDAWERASFGPLL